MPSSVLLHTRQRTHCR